MGRSTFEGPILSGDNRFGPLRNVGYTDLVQDCGLILTNTTNATAGYSGGSGQFVNGNGIPNVNAVVFTPSATAYPPSAATITADAGTGGAGTLYRGCVMYVPYGSNISDFLIDTAAAITMTGGTVGTVTVSIGNGFNTTTYGTVTSANSVGRNSIAYTGAELIACQSTTGDITNPPSQYGGGGGTSPYASLVSQVVFTLTIPYTGGSGTTLPTITAGTFFIAMRYAQLDANIGNQTTYPYGNFD